MSRLHFGGRRATAHFCRMRFQPSKWPGSEATTARGVVLFLLALHAVTWPSLTAAQQPCGIHDQCGSEWFCSNLPPGVGPAAAGSCEPCWKCCLLPQRYNATAVTNAAGGLLSGGCTTRCGCNPGRACRRDSDCAAGLFCWDRGQLEVPVCRPCTECDEATCAPKCPGGPVLVLLGPPPRNATSHDPALRDAAVFLSLALEPWRSEDSDRTQVQAQELRQLLRNETQLLGGLNATLPYDWTASFIVPTAPYSDMFVETALARVFRCADPPSNGSSMPLKDVAELLLRGSRALLCPAVPDASSARSPASAAAAPSRPPPSPSPSPLPRRTGPGCPCNTSVDAATFRCPAGFACSRGARLALSFDLLSDPSWAKLGGQCVPCMGGQLCPEGTYVPIEPALRVPDCPAGHYCPTPGEAIHCPAGFFCPGRTPAPITCTYTSLLEASTQITRQQEDGLNVFRHLWRDRQPARGNYCPEGSSRPDTPCRGGSFCPSASVQIECPRGSYCKPQSVRPVKCPPLVRCPAGAAAPDGRPLAGMIFAAVDAAVLLLYGLMLLGKCLVARFLCGWNLEEEPTTTEGSDPVCERGAITSKSGDRPSANRDRTSRVRIELGSPRTANANAGIAGPDSNRSLLAASAGDGDGPNSFTAAFAAVAAAATANGNCTYSASAVTAASHGSFVVAAGPISPLAVMPTPFSRYTMDGTPVATATPAAAAAAAAGGGGDDWDDPVLLEPNDAAAYGKVLQGRYYSFKAHQTITIRFDNVRLDGRLMQVRGAFESGRLNVVMGPSGCGKSTLVELLSGRLPAHDLDAFEVTASRTQHQQHQQHQQSGLPPLPPGQQHHPYHRRHQPDRAPPGDCVGGHDEGQRKQICLSRTVYRSLLGFVPQEDILHADLTVRENLAYSARLKLPRSVSCNDVDAIIDETLDMLDMEHLRHSRTGSVERKSLSGGQRKRVSIGVEIVGKRPVMFMDEPTSGLDATTSYELCVLLSQIAKTFRINVIVVIHQPSYRCFRLFDSLLLLGRHGELTFHGRPRDCVSHFRALGYRVVLKDCAETILDIVYRNQPPPTLDAVASAEPLARGKIELVLKSAGAEAPESGAAEAAQTSDSVHCVSWSPDGRTLALSTGDGTMQLCDVASGGCVALLKGHSNCVRSVSWRPCGFGAAQLASGGDDLSVRVWRHGDDASTAPAAAAAGGACVATLEGHTRVITCVTWSPDGRFMASAGSWDKTVRLWDPASPHSIATLEHRQPVSAVAWSPDGRILASGSNDGAVWLWDTERCKAKGRLKGHTDWVRSVSWCLNSRNLVSGSSDRTLRLWDAVARECLATLEGHDGYVTSVSWSPGGVLVASGSGDRCVRVWDATNGACVAVMQGHKGAVASVAWSPDGRTLASGSSDGTVRLLDACSGIVKLSYAAKLHQARGSHGGSSCGFRDWLRRRAQGADSQTPRDVQLACLIHRNLVKSSRVPLGAILLDVMYLQIAALIVGCIQGSAWAPSKVPSNFVMAYLVLSMLAAVTHLRTFSVSRMVQSYERMSGVSVSATFLSSNITDLGWVFLSPAIYFSIYYFINSPQAGFRSFYVLGFLVCWWSSGLSYVISTSVMPHQHHTTVAVIGTLIMGAFLHGLSPSIASARHSVMGVVLGVSYSRWAMEAITIQELRSGDHYAWNEAVAVQSSIGICNMDLSLSSLGGGEGRSRDTISEEQALGFLQLWGSYNYGTCELYYSRAKTVLFCMGVGMRLVAWLQMKFLKTWIVEASASLHGLRKSIQRWRRVRALCDQCHEQDCCRTCSGAVQDDGAATPTRAAAAGDSNSLDGAAGFPAGNMGVAGFGGHAPAATAAVGGHAIAGFAPPGGPLPTIASRGSVTVVESEVVSQPSRPTINLLGSGALSISVLATCNTV